MNKTLIPKSKAKTAYGLLSEICQLIRTEPKRYKQSAWLLKGRDIRMYCDDVPACGTVACVAGWVVTLKKPRGANDDNIQDRANAILGLLTDEQSDELFRGDAVSRVAPNGVSGPSQTPQYAALGIKHIRAFQKKYAVQLKAKKV